MQTDASPPAPQAPAAQEIHQQATLWLVLSLTSSLFCASLCLGVGGAVFCYLAMQSAGHGLLADAEAKLKWGKILTIVGSVLGIITTSLSLIFR
jgi:tetrahydromethanopterin S-methyltransferase subunit E